MKSICAFLFIFYLYSGTYSQNLTSFSEEKFNNYKEKAKLYVYTNLDSAFYYANKIEASNNNTHKAFAFSIKSYLYQLKLQTHQSKLYETKAFQLLEVISEFEDKTKLKTVLLNYKGLSEWKRGNNQKALEAYFKGKEIALKTADIIQTIKFNNNIASVLSEIKNFKKAIAIARESDALTDQFVHLYELEAFNQSKATVNYKLGTFYENFYNETQNNKYLDSAQYFYKKTLTYSKKESVNYVYSLMNLGKIQYYRSEFKEAKKNYLQILNNGYTNTSTPYLGYLYLNLAQLCIKEKNIHEAIVYLKKIESSLILQKNESLQMYYLYYMAKCYDAIENKNEAFDHAKSFLEIYNQKKQMIAKDEEAINFLLSQNVATQEIEKIKKENENSTIFYDLLKFILVVLVFSLCFLGLKLILKKKQAKELEDEINVLKIEKQTMKKLSPETDSEKNESSVLNLDQEKEQEILKGLEDLEKKEMYLKEGYTLQFVAKKLKTNTTYVSYVVNKIYDKSFSEYTNELKINYVIKELEQNPIFRKYSTQAMAESIGYKRANSFTVSFKKRTGVTPVQYIKTIEENH